MKGASAANVIAMAKAIARPMFRDRIGSPPRINHEETESAKVFSALPSRSRFLRD
jgi:hypothetical protein